MWDGSGGVIRLPKTHSKFRVVRELAEARVRHEVSRIDLGEASGYHHMMIGRYERGETTPSLKTLCDLAEALGYDVVLTPKQT